MPSSQTRGGSKRPRKEPDTELPSRIFSYGGECRRHGGLLPPATHQTSSRGAPHRPHGTDGRESGCLHPVPRGASPRVMAERGRSSPERATSDAALRLTSCGYSRRRQWLVVSPRAGRFGALEGVEQPSRRRRDVPRHVAGRGPESRGGPRRPLVPRRRLVRAVTRAVRRSAPRTVARRHGWAQWGSRRFAFFAGRCCRVENAWGDFFGSTWSVEGDASGRLIVPIDDTELLAGRVAQAARDSFELESSRARPTSKSAAPWIGSLGCPDNSVMPSRPICLVLTTPETARMFLVDS